MKKTIFNNRKRIYYPLNMGYIETGKVLYNIISESLYRYKKLKFNTKNTKL